MRNIFKQILQFLIRAPKLQSLNLWSGLSVCSVLMSMCESHWPSSSSHCQTKLPRVDICCNIPFPASMVQHCCQGYGVVDVIDPSNSCVFYTVSHISVIENQTWMHCLLLYLTSQKALSSQQIHIPPLRGNFLLISFMNQ